MEEYKIKLWEEGLLILDDLKSIVPIEFEEGRKL